MQIGSQTWCVELHGIMYHTATVTCHVSQDVFDDPTAASTSDRQQAASCFDRRLYMFRRQLIIASWSHTSALVINPVHRDSMLQHTVPEGWQPN
jgi:hypothetical protein